MKKSKSLFVPLFVLSALLVFAPLNTAAANEFSTIYVTGTGEITVKPDSAQISLGVVTEGSSAGDAQKDNAKIVNRLLNALLESGIEEKHIQTKDFNVQPQYDYSSDRTRIAGYEARNSVVVHVQDLDALGAVIDTARDAGVNQINNIRFLTSQESDLRTKALAAAVANARTKANTIANALGKSVSDVINVTVESDRYATPYFEQKVAMTDMAMGTSESTSIMTGELTITSTVQIQFSMK